MQTASVSGINVSDVVHNIMKKQLLHKKDDGSLETPLDVFIRVSKHIAIGHAKYDPNNVDKFIDKATELMYSQKFMPNTPTLSNAGLHNAQLSACFVLPIYDTLESIYTAHLHQGLIHASGGGTGFSFSSIRSKNTLAAGRLKTRGVVNWLKMLNENSVHVAQGMRDGANMGMLSIGHPDIIDFITCKSNGYKISYNDIMNEFGVSEQEAKRIKAIIGIEKFNLSVSIVDKFMEALDKHESWYLIDPHTKEKKQTLDAEELWNMIVNNAYNHGEPGLFFKDTANRYNTLPSMGEYETTNPCGEQVLAPYESCNLGHINLGKFVIGHNGTSQFNWSDFEDTIRFGMQFLDDVVEVNSFPIKELREVNLGTRRVGLGIMGWADTLAKMNIPYDSDMAIDKIHEIGEFFNEISLDESRKMGKDRGNFGYFDNSIFNGVEKYMRNSNRTTIAPTGSTSMYAMCSSSIEPIFSPVIIREQAGMIQVDYHPELFKMLKENNLDTQEIRDKLQETNGSIRDASFLPDKIKSIFPTAHDILPEWHVKHQATWQKYITSAVSKTVNLRHDSTINDVDKVYKLAYKLGCKGITVYRDGSRMNQTLRTRESNTNKRQNKRAVVTIGSNRKIPNGCGNLMVYVGGDEDGVHEITARLGKGGGCAAAQTEAIARMASIAMQEGVSPENISKQLSGIRCHLTAMYRSKHVKDERPRTITSCGDAIAVALNEHIAEINNNTAQHENINTQAGACPDCGSTLAFEEGCKKCYNCGFSMC